MYKRRTRGHKREEEEQIEEPVGADSVKEDRTDKMRGRRDKMRGGKENEGEREREKSSNRDGNYSE